MGTEHSEKTLGAGKQDMESAWGCCLLFREEVSDKSLEGPFSKNNSGDSLEKYHNIKKETLIFNIVKIVL